MEFFKKKQINKCLYCDQELSGSLNKDFFENTFSNRSGMICRDCLDDIRHKK